MNGQKEKIELKISLVVPVYNEDIMIPIFYKAIKNHLLNRDYRIELIFINDGSSDDTETILMQLEEQDESLKAIHFSRNFGKEAALFAGLKYTTGDAVIPIDVDLQDPLDVVVLMVEKWQQTEADVVLAKRIDRSNEGLLKRKSAEYFYALHNKLSQLKIEPNVGDFRLLSRETVDHILTLQEKNLFMKGLLSWVGGKTEIVEYAREKRVAGSTKFNGWKLWNFAIEGITSFSTAPLRIWTYLGFGIATIAFLYGVWMIFDTLFWGNEVKGYPSLMVSIMFLGGVQLIGIGVLGEYIGRIYLETKNRPSYILKNKKSIEINKRVVNEQNNKS